MKKIKVLCINVILLYDVFLFFSVYNFGQRMFGREVTIPMQWQLTTPHPSIILKSENNIFKKYIYILQYLIFRYVVESLQKHSFVFLRFAIIWVYIYYIEQCDVWFYRLVIGVVPLNQATLRPFWHSIHVFGNKWQLAQFCDVGPVGASLPLIISLGALLLILRSDGQHVVWGCWMNVLICTSIWFKL